MQGRLNLAGALAVTGAVALLIGLSLDWYEPEISAWTAFEVVDLLLAAIAIGVVVVALARSPERPRLEAAAGWLPIAALAALVLVVAAMVNPPPAAIDRALEVGAWVSLGGALLLVAAALLATTELSVVVTMRPRPPRRGSSGREGHSLVADEPAWEPSEEPEPFEEPPIEAPEEPPTDESPLDQRPMDGFGDEAHEPVDEGLVPPGAFDPEEETRPLPRRRRG